MEFDDEENSLTAHQAMELHKGSELVDGPFELTYNDDGEGYYYIRRFGEVHNISYSFQTVEIVGESSFNLVQDDQKAGMYIEDIDNYNLLKRALITIAE